MLSRRARIVLLPVIGIIGLVLLAGYPAAEVRADTNPIDLRLGGEGATSWNINNIKPGDSGTTTVALLNAGRQDGFVTIWISNLVSIEGPSKRPGKFADYLLLSASGQGLVSNFRLPAVMASFPQTPSGAYYIRVNLLRAGDTVTIVWRWELPPQTGNDVQGNGISFSINYLLEELHPPQAGVEIPEEPSLLPRILQTNTGGKTSSIKMSADGVMQETATLADSSGNFGINLDQGSRVTGPGGIVLERLELAVAGKTTTEQQTIGELTVLPQNMVALSPVYKITGYSDGAEVSRVNFDPYTVITLSYDPKGLPENALTPFIVNFVRDGNLRRLEPPPDSVFEVGKAKGVAYHASYFAVVTEVAAPPPPLPVSFGVSHLIISPGQASLRQPVSISVDIANDGAVTGSYQLYLVINGIVRAVKEITLEPKSIMTVRFEVADLAAGKHQVKIGGLTGEFRIVSTVVSPPGSPIDWSLIDLSIFAIIVAGLLASYLVIRRSQRQGPGSI